MKFDITQFTINELVEIREKISSHIYSYEDGYDYICTVSSYGRRWKENISNEIELQELCHRYNGDEGIVDVYSTNPSLSIHNYGSVQYIKSLEDYKKWREYEDTKSLIVEIEEDLQEWDNKDNVPFKQRPFFAPVYNSEELDVLKKRLAEFDMSFTPPVSYSEIIK